MHLQLSVFILRIALKMYVIATEYTFMKKSYNIRTRSFAPFFFSKTIKNTKRFFKAKKTKLFFYISMNYKVNFNNIYCYLFLCFLNESSKITWTAHNNDEQKTDYGIWRMELIYMCWVDKNVSLIKLFLQHHAESYTRWKLAPRQQSYVRKWGEMATERKKQERSIETISHAICYFYQQSSQRQCGCSQALSYFSQTADSYNEWGKWGATPILFVSLKLFNSALSLATLSPIPSTSESLFWSRLLKRKKKTQARVQWIQF